MHGTTEQQKPAATAFDTGAVPLQTNQPPPNNNSHPTVTVSRKDSELSIPDSASSASTASTISPHYNPKEDVIVHLEFLPDKIIKRIIASVWFAIIAGLAVLVAALVYKLDKDHWYFFRHDNIYVVNVVFASLQLFALTIFYGYFIMRLFQAKASGKRWSHRRSRTMRISFVELTLQFINSVLFLVPNAYALQHECGWFDPIVPWTAFVRWTIWNTLFLLFIVQLSSAMPLSRQRRRQFEIFRPDGVVMDMSIWVHWPKWLVLWVPLEAMLLTLTVEAQLDPNMQPQLQLGESCRDVKYDCTFNTTMMVASNLVQAWTIAYFLAYCYYLWFILNYLRRKPYNKYRIGNMIVRLQARLRLLAFGVFVVTSVCYFYVDWNTCSSYVVSWFGYLPMQIVMTAVAIAHGYFTTPKDPEENNILLVWLQEFAWAEADLPRKKQERSSSLPPAFQRCRCSPNQPSPNNSCMECEPMFCFETAIKLMYWAYLAYDVNGKDVENGFGIGSTTATNYNGTTTTTTTTDTSGTTGTEDSTARMGTRFDSDTALALYDLEHLELVWEKELDSQALIAWSSDTVLVSFRGTASMANVLADIQAWRTRHPKESGIKMRRWWRGVPMVHTGFLKAYTANNFNERILSRITQIVGTCSAGIKATRDRPVKVIVCGHSLGGALAMLCALDMQSRFTCPNAVVNAKVYTFGAPRVGNHAFADLYNEQLPDTFQLVNSDDMVVRAAKFLFLFKHAGKRVSINRRGDLVVRPSYIEVATRKLPGGGSVRDHLLTAYQRSMLAVITAQFGSKALGATEDVLALAADERTRAVLASACGVVSQKYKSKSGKEGATQTTFCRQVSAAIAAQELPLSEEEEEGQEGFEDLEAGVVDSEEDHKLQKESPAADLTGIVIGSDTFPTSTVDKCGEMCIHMKVADKSKPKRRVPGGATRSTSHPKLPSEVKTICQLLNQKKGGGGNGGGRKAPGAASRGVNTLSDYSPSTMSSTTAASFTTERSMSLSSAEEELEFTDTATSGGGVDVVGDVRGSGPLPLVFSPNNT